MECPTRSLTLPVLIVRAKALMQPGWLHSQDNAARFVEGERYRMSYQVTIILALPVLGTLKRSLRTTMSAFSGDAAHSRKPCQPISLTPLKLLFN
jgi:hypothetical protein